MATAPAPVTTEQHLHTPYSSGVNFIDGVISKGALGAFDHGRLQGLFSASFLQRMSSTGLAPCKGLRRRVFYDRERCVALSAAYVFHGTGLHRAHGNVLPIAGTEPTVEGNSLFSQHGMN